MLISVRARKAPGLVAIHQALMRYLRPSAMMLPKLGVGGCRPSPRKPRIASKIIIRATSSTATKAIGGSTLGMINNVMIRQSEAPSTLAPRTNSLPRSLCVTLRATRA